ncbi:MAG: hypothetical protein ACNI26_13120 [Terasakiella sp.]|uniref:hypothetical protein n=1 Tax=unclassified Terasakiella TaxID=2614952 RepID=UPI003AFFED84
MSNIVDLGKHVPSAGSIITRLYRHMDEIENITVVVTWKDGSKQTSWDNKKISQLCHDGKVLEAAILEEVAGSE